MEEGKYIEYLSERVAVGKIKKADKEYSLINVYIPSRDRSDVKIKRKKRFIKSLSGYLKRDNSSTIFCGDFNVVSKNHVPKYPIFKDWEYSFFDHLKKVGFYDSYTGKEDIPYSWIGRTGNGYRYDYAFVGENIECQYSDYCDEAISLGLIDHKGILLKVD